MSKSTGLPSSPTASALLDALELMGSGEPPAIRWSAEIQPQPLRRARVDGGHGTHLTPKCRAYRNDLQTRWRYAMLAGTIPKRPLEGELFVAMAFAGSSSTKAGGAPRPDRTNLEKAIEDAGNELLWADDIQLVQGLSVVHGWGLKVRPFVSLEVWQLEGNGVKTWPKQDPKHSSWCAKAGGVPGVCSCARSRTARSLRTLRDIEEGRHRCGSKHVEWSADGKKRTWRCTRMIGQAHVDVDHESEGGRRRWSDTEAIAS